jgi:hypothetical protein
MNENAPARNCRRISSRLVDGYRRVVDCVLFAILLCAELLAITERRNDVGQDRGIADQRFELRARLDGPREDRPLPCEKRAVAILPDAQRGAGLPQLAVRPVEQSIVEKTPRKNEAAAGSQHCLAGRLDIRENELDLLLERHLPLSQLHQDFLTLTRAVPGTPDDHTGRASRFVRREDLGCLIRVADRRALHGD